MPLKLTPHEGYVFLQGQLDDHTDLTPLKAVSGPVRLVFRELMAMNSVGLGKLVTYASFAYMQLEYYECPRFFVDMLNAVPSVLGPKGDTKIVKSVIAPFHCTTCNVEHATVVQTREVQIAGQNVFTPPMACPTCGAIMRFADDPTDVFFFMMPRKKA